MNSVGKVIGLRDRWRDVDVGGATQQPVGTGVFAMLASEAEQLGVGLAGVTQGRIAQRWLQPRVLRRTQQAFMDGAQVFGAFFGLMQLQMQVS